MSRKKLSKKCYNPGLSCSFCNKPEKEVLKIVKGPGVGVCDECIELCNDIVLDAKPKSKTKRPRGILSAPKKIKQALDKSIVNQDQTKKILSVAVYNHYTRTRNPELKLEKNNVLLIGPSGCGKTLFAKTISEFLNVPFAITDANSLTASGYVGEDVESILCSLYRSAEGDIEHAQKGIIFIDEIDKLATSQAPGTSTQKDVGGTAVQQSLLKIIEGTTVRIAPEDGSRKRPDSEGIAFNTENILFIFGGAFVGIDEIIADRYYSKSDTVLPEDLYKYGLIPEFVGRIPVIAKLNALKLPELKRILTEPENSIIKQYINQFAVEGVKLSFENAALDYIASEALKRNTGARGLRSIIESIMLDAMYILPEKRNRECIVKGPSDEKPIPEVVFKAKPKNKTKKSSTLKAA